MMDPGCLYEGELASHTFLEERQAEDDRQREFKSNGGYSDIGGYDSEDWCADNCGCGYYAGGQFSCLGKPY